MLTADPAGKFVSYESPERTVQVFHMDGTPDGPRIAPGFRTGVWPVALSPQRGLIWIASFERGTLRCYDWRTGDLRWERIDAYRRLASLHCCGGAGRSTLLVRQYASRGIVGPLRALDQGSGEELGLLAAVHGSHAQSDNPWIVTTAKGHIEFRRELSAPPYWRFETGTLDVSVALDGDRALVSQAGGLVKCFDLARGVMAWKHDCGEGQWLRMPALPHGSNVAFGLLTHVDVGGRGTPLFLDVSSGQVVRRGAALEHPAYEIVDRGRAVVGSEGILTLAEMKWTPFERPIR